MSGPIVETVSTPGGRRGASIGAGRRDCDVVTLPTRGQAAVEYLIVVALLALALAVGPQSPLEQLFRAVADRYERFSYAISHP